MSCQEIGYLHFKCLNVNDALHINLCRCDCSAVNEASRATPTGHYLTFSNDGRKWPVCCNTTATCNLEINCVVESLLTLFVFMCS